MIESKNIVDKITGKALSAPEAFIAYCAAKVCSAKVSLNENLGGYKNDITIRYNNNVFCVEFDSVSKHYRKKDFEKNNTRNAVLKQFGLVINLRNGWSVKKEPSNELYKEVKIEGAIQQYDGYEGYYLKPVSNDNDIISIPCGFERGYDKNPTRLQKEMDVKWYKELFTIIFGEKAPVFSPEKDYLYCLELIQKNN